MPVLPQRLNKARTVAVALLVLLLGPAAIAFYLHAPAPQHTCSSRGSHTALGAEGSTTTSSRRAAVSRRDWGASVLLPGAAATLGLFGLTGVAGAAADPAKAGTKDDPAYQKCLSNCMYFCTKPKGEAQRSRAECLPGCKEQCAQTKAQTMLGKPK